MLSRRFLSTIIIVLLTVIIIMWHDLFVLRGREQHVKDDDYYSEEYKDMVDKIRRRQHDFNNQINAIYSQHYTSSTYEELVERQRKYCDYLKQESRYDNLVLINNRVLAGFLYGKFREIESEGISIKSNITIDEFKCVMDNYEIINIVAILLDNAVEASEKYIETYNGSKYPLIECSMYENNSYAVLKVSNIHSYVKYDDILMFFENGTSSKGKGRGIGLYNVKKLCDSHKSEIIIANRECDTVNYIDISVAIPKN